MFWGTVRQDNLQLREASLLQQQILQGESTSDMIVEPVFVLVVFIFTSDHVTEEFGEAASPPSGAPHRRHPPSPTQRL